HFQQWRMRVVGRRENYGINLLVGERVLDVLKCARCAIVVFSVGDNRLFAVVTPQVADRVHFHVVTGRELGNDQVQVASSATVADMAERYSVICPQNSSV